MKKLSWQGFLQFVRWHRRGVALTAIFLALVTGLSAFQSSTSGLPVVTAARALAAGEVLAAEDLMLVQLPADLVPDEAITRIEELVGLSLCVGVTRGTPITQADLVVSSLIDQSSDEMLVPFRIHDAEVVNLLRLGDRLTIVAATPEGTVYTVAEHVRVAQLPMSASAGGLLNGGSTSGALIVVATWPTTARQLAAFSDQQLGVVIE